MAIYTKKGDEGKTSLKSGEKVWKSDKRVEAYGTVDELNCSLGLLRAEIGNPKKKHQKYLLEIITSVQNDLFYIGSYLAGSDNKSIGINLVEKVSGFEKEIDEMTKKMPELKNFILPDGTKLGTLLQFTRSIARRAERKIVKLSRNEIIEKDLLVYINRLSDLLFTMSRFANFSGKIKETIWSSFAKASEDKQKKIG